MGLSLILLLIAAIFCNRFTSSDPSVKNCSVAECINSGNTDTSSVIICNSCTLKIISNSGRALKFYELQRAITNENGIDRLKLIDLNEDVLMMIFDQLELVDMMRLCDTYREKILSSIARKNFRSRYNSYKISINGSGDYSDIETNTTTKKIKVRSENSLQLFRIFGSEIRRLKITHPSHEMMQYINIFMSDSLVSLWLRHGKHDTLHQFSKPFNMVEDFTFSPYSYNEDNDGSNRINADHMPLNQIFPNVRRLSLAIYVDEEIDSMYCEFPHLEHFYFYHPSEQRIPSILAKFFRINPHIQSINLGYLDQNMGNMLNIHLNNLQNLTVRIHSFNILENTTLDHIKHLKIEQCIFWYNYTSMNNLLFPSIQSLDISYTQRALPSWKFNIEYVQIASSIWAEFGRRHKNVRRLRIADVLEPDHNIIEWMKEYQNLTEIEIEHGTDYTHRVATTTIYQIIEMNEKLVKLNLLAFCLSDNELNDLEETLESEWHINTHNYHLNGQDLVDLSFEKRN